MKLKIILPTILFLAAAVLSIYIFASNRVNPAPPVNNGGNNNYADNTGIILYYGDTCPHCKIVEDYIKENNITEKIVIEQKEVYHNQENSAELAEKAGICGLPTNSVGVPFLWDGSACIIGDKNIIAFLKQATGQ